MSFTIREFNFEVQPPTQPGTAKQAKVQVKIVLTRVMLSQEGGLALLWLARIQPAGVNHPA